MKDSQGGGRRCRPASTVKDITAIALAAAIVLFAAPTDIFSASLEGQAVVNPAVDRSAEYECLKLASNGAADALASLSAAHIGDADKLAALSAWNLDAKQPLKTGFPYTLVAHEAVSLFQLAAQFSEDFPRIGFPDPCHDFGCEIFTFHAT